MIDNIRRSFWISKVREDKLGGYVYCLVDPNGSEVFYVGKGGGILGQGNDRPDRHLKAAYEVFKSRKNGSAKDNRIIDIWRADRQPDVVIVRRQLTSEQAHEVEAALIDFLNWRQKLTNKVSGHGSDKGLVDRENQEELTADPVYPPIKIPNVWLFNISGALALNKVPYEALRGDWVVAQPTDNGYAVGLVKGLSRIVCQIEKWEKSPEDNKRKRFSGKILPEGDPVSLALLHKDFGAITKQCGAWKRGRQLRVDFDDAGFVTVAYNGSGRIRLLAE
jgi:hypothetical protein